MRYSKLLRIIFQYYEIIMRKKVDNDVILVRSLSAQGLRSLRSTKRAPAECSTFVLEGIGRI